MIGSFWRGLVTWRKRARHARDARRMLDALFADPSRLAGTSLRPEQRARADIVEVEPASDGTLRAFSFAILRHPRPYPFSRQFHEVLELYRFDLETRRVERVRTLNVSRARGRDGEPPGGGVA